MAKVADLITRLIVDSNGHDAGLKKASLSIKGYMVSAKDMSTAISGVMGVMGKFAGGIGIAMTATEAFTKVMNSSQTTADNMQIALSTVSSTVDTFANAIATCDLSAFSQGLGTIVSKAVEAAMAVDQLGNTLISYNFFKSGISADLAEQMTILKDKGASQEQKEQAKKAAQDLINQQSELVKNLNYQIMDTVRKTIADKGKGVLNAGNFGMSDIRKVFAIDAYGNPAFNREQMQKRYEEWQMKEQQRSRQGSTKWGSRYDLIEEYRDAILANMMLTNIGSDKELEDISNLIQQADNATRELESQKRALNKAINGVDTEIKQPKVKVPKVTVPKPEPEPEPLVEGSLAWYQDKLKDANKELMNAATDEARYAANKVVEELQEQITRMKQTITFKDVNDEFQKVAGKDAKMPGIGSDPAAKQVKTLDKIKISYEDMGSTAVEQMDAVGMAMDRMGRAVGGNAGEWLSWAGNLASAISTAIPLIDAFTKAKNAQGTAEATEAAKGAASSVANIPVVGPALAVAAIASVVAALMSIPKFAKGGLAYGPTLGLFGEYSGAANNPEVVAPLDRLRSLIGDTGTGGQVEFRIQGRELVGILNKQNHIDRRNA